MDHPTTVIIADNSEEFCSALTDALHRTGRYEIVGTALDGEQALRTIYEQKPDILVLDLMLAKKEGISILKELAV